MSAIIVLLTILLITGIGYLLIWGFGFIEKESLLAKIAYSYGLGVGVIAFQLYLYAMLATPWEKIYLLSPWLVVFLLLMAKNRKKLKKTHLKLTKFPMLKNIDKLLLFLILVTCSYVIFEALLRPVTTWDAWAIWLMKSKIFFIDKTIHPQILQYIKSDYPLVVSLFGTFMYLMIGHVNDTSVLLTSTAFYVFLALLFFTKLKDKYGITYALLFTFLLVTTQTFIRQGGRLEAGEADLPLGYFVFCSVTLLFTYLKSSNAKDLLLVSIFLGITTMVKFEGVPTTILVLLFILYHIHKFKLYKQIQLLIIGIAPIIYWEFYLKINHIGISYFAAHIIVFSLKKILNSIFGTVKELINIKSWNMLWIIYFLSFFLFDIRKNPVLIVLNTIILFQLAVYMTMYLFTAGNNPESSIERLLVHIAPLAFYSLAMVTYKRISFFKNHKTLLTKKFPKNLKI